MLLVLAELMALGVRRYRHRQVAEIAEKSQQEVPISIVGASQISAEASELGLTFQVDFAAFRIPPNEYKQMLAQQVAMLLAVKQLGSTNPGSASFLGISWVSLA